MNLDELKFDANGLLPVVVQHQHSGQVLMVGFANREAVAIALLDEHFRAVIQYVRKRLAGATTLEEYFSRLVDSSFEFEGLSDTPVRKITNGFSAGASSVVAVNLMSLAARLRVAAGGGALPVGGGDALAASIFFCSQAA